MKYITLIITEEQSIEMGRLLRPLFQARGGDYPEFFGTSVGNKVRITTTLRPLYQALEAGADYHA